MISQKAVGLQKTEDDDIDDDDDDDVTLTFDLSTKNHMISRISQGHSLYQTLYQLWACYDYQFLSYDELYINTIFNIRPSLRMRCIIWSICNGPNIIPHFSIGMTRNEYLDKSFA